MGTNERDREYKGSQLTFCMHKAVEYNISRFAHFSMQDIGRLQVCLIPEIGRKELNNEQWNDGWFWWSLVVETWWEEAYQEGKEPTDITLGRGRICDDKKQERKRDQVLHGCSFSICVFSLSVCLWSLPSFSTLVLSRKKSPTTSESAVGRSRGQKKTCFHASRFFIGKLLDFPKEGDEGWVDRWWREGLKWETKRGIL